MLKVSGIFGKPGVAQTRFECTKTHARHVFDIIQSLIGASLLDYTTPRLTILVRVVAGLDFFPYHRQLEKPRLRADSLR